MQEFVYLLDIVAADTAGNQDRFMKLADVAGSFFPIKTLTGAARKCRGACVEQNHFRWVIVCLSNGKFVVIAICLNNGTDYLTGIFSAFLPVQLNVVQAYSGSDFIDNM